MFKSIFAFPMMYLVSKLIVLFLSIIFIKKISFIEITSRIKSLNMFSKNTGYLLLNNKHISIDDMTDLKRARKLFN